MKAIRVGIIGFGMAGRIFHAPIIESVPGFVLTHAYTQSKENRIFLQVHYPHVACLNQVDELIGHPDIDLVVIATSNEVHASLAQIALEAGKHVVVEKPFTITTEEADRLIVLAEQKGLILSVHHNARWNNDFLTIKKLLKEGKLGDIVSYEGRYDRFRPKGKPGAWRENSVPGSGILYDLGAHLVDQALQLFGWPNSLFATLSIQRKEVQATDDFLIILKYDALKVILRGSMLALESPFRYHINGTNGSFTKNGIDPQEEHLIQGFKPHTINFWGVENEDNAGLLSIVESDGMHVQQKITSQPGYYPAFYEGLAEAIVHQKQPPVTAAQARDVIYLLELCEKSQSEQRVMSCGASVAY